MTRVVISGIRHPLEAALAIEYGADAISFLITPIGETREGYVSMTVAQRIVGVLPPMVTSIYVTSQNEPAKIADEVIASKVSTLQLHGHNTAKQAELVKGKLFGAKVLKALHVEGLQTIDEMATFNGVDGFVLDAVDHDETLTGKPVDLAAHWRLARIITDNADKPITLAGGLSQENVKQAIDTVHPFAVDVNAGVSGDDGFKDPAKMKAFIRNAKNA